MDPVEFAPHAVFIMETFQISKDLGRQTLYCSIGMSRFDASVTQEFKQAVDSEWSGDVHRIVLDFEAVDFIDSSGVGALLSLQKRITLGDQPITLKNAGKNVVEVIELLRLHRVFNLNPAVE